MAAIAKFQKPLLIAGSLVGGYFIYKAIKNRQPSQGTALLNDESAAKAKGQSLSYTQATYVNLANVIFNAWFQNFNIFNPVNEAQILSVMSKIGWPRWPGRPRKWCNTPSCRSRQWYWRRVCSPSPRPVADPGRPADRAAPADRPTCGWRK
jgi:hypothetical protein